jgi:hypothetical protein
VRLVDLIYGQKWGRSSFKSVNGIGAKDDYIMARIYYEADLDNVFYRKVSDFDSYQPPADYLNRIETRNIPVFSFRYKTPFSKSEEKEFGENYNIENFYAQLGS